MNVLIRSLDEIIHGPTLIWLNAGITMARRPHEGHENKDVTPAKAGVQGLSGVEVTGFRPRIKSGVTFFRRNDDQSRRRVYFHRRDQTNPSQPAHVAPRIQKALWVEPALV